MTSLPLLLALVANLAEDGRKWKALIGGRRSPLEMVPFWEGRVAQCAEILTWISKHTDDKAVADTATAAAEELIPA